MNSNLQEKRKEIFDLHQSWLRPDAPLMRQAPRPQRVEESVQDVESIPFFKKNNTIIVIVFITSLLIILELVFFAYQLGWFK